MNSYLLSERYIRQSSLPGIGQAGQARLDSCRIAVVGAGGLASPLLLSLAGAGIGHITIVDYDRVSISNLNRQFLYRFKDVGRYKAKLAARRLLDYRPDLRVSVVLQKIDASNAAEIIMGHDMIASAVDNLETRYILNNAACSLGISFSDAAVGFFGGYSIIVDPGRSACYECFAGPEKKNPDRLLPGTISPGHVLGSVATTVGSLQANMIIGSLLGINDVPAGTAVFYDGRRQSIEQLEIKRDINCRVCSVIKLPGQNDSEKTK